MIPLRKVREAQQDIVKTASIELQE